MVASGANWDPGDLSIGLAQLLLGVCGTQVWVRGREHLPAGAAVIISNHRSPLDAPILIQALNRPIRFACHYYLTQVPGLREITLGLGCIPLSQGRRNQVRFFRQAESRLRRQECIGLFPEGADRITQPSLAGQVGLFQSGFAHLALRSQVEPLPIVPVVIRVEEEWTAPAVPLRFFRWFDDSEPLFQRLGDHPVVIYRTVSVIIAPPLWISAQERGLPSQERALYIRNLTHNTQQLLQGILGEPTLLPQGAR